jgi:hypothetical protein
MPQDAMPAPAGARSIPDEGDRAAVCRPIAGVVRSGDELIAARGADLSPYCIHCGVPSAGKPLMLGYIPPNGSTGDLAGCMDEPAVALIAVLFLAAYAVLGVIVPRLRSRQQARIVAMAVGLCDRHRRRRRRIFWAAGVVLLGSLGLLAGGLWAWFRARYQTGDDTTTAQSLMIAGLVFAILGPVLVLTRLRTPRLTTARDGRVVITGAGRAVS